MSNSGIQPRTASGRKLEDGSSSEGKEMGNGNGMIASQSKDLLRRLLRASGDSDRNHAIATPGKFDPKMPMGSGFPRPDIRLTYHPTILNVEIQRSMNLTFFVKRPQHAIPLLFLPHPVDIGNQWLGRTFLEDGGNVGG